MIINRYLVDANYDVRGRNRKKFRKEGCSDIMKEFVLEKCCRN